MRRLPPKLGGDRGLGAPERRTARGDHARSAQPSRADCESDGLMRWLGIVFIVALLGIGFFAFQSQEAFFGLPPATISVLIWGILAFLLVAGAGSGFRRIRLRPGQAALALLIWAGVLVIIAALYTLSTR